MEFKQIFTVSQFVTIPLAFSAIGSLDFKDTACSFQNESIHLTTSRLLFKYIVLYSLYFFMKWITREHAKVDRIACPWLIKNFVDKDAEFLFVPAEKVKL